MRTRVLAPVVVVAAVVGASCTSSRATTATASPPPRLPSFRQRFTPVLPCPRKPVTTLDLEGCAERDIVRTDAAIDARARAVFSLLDAKGRRTFVTAERAWLAYRRASCMVESSKYAGGSIEPVIFGVCVVKKNRSHLAELAALRRDLRHR
jgi:uncharacterized protein YecT (DUF1311 family)